MWLRDWGEVCVDNKGLKILSYEFHCLIITLDKTQTLYRSHFPTHGHVERPPLWEIARPSTLYSYPLGFVGHIRFQHVISTLIRDVTANERTRPSVKMTSFHNAKDVS